jgi:hypothetical protein
MEKLRAELQKIRVAAAQPTAPTAAVPAAAAVTPGTPPDKPAQVAVVSPSPSPPSAPAAAASTSAAPPAAQTGGIGRPPQQLAIAAPPAFRPATSPSTADEWKEAIAMLEKSLGKLSYSKAMALLLGVTTEAELEMLIKYEALLKRIPYSSAAALGVNPGGFIGYASAGRQPSRVRATESAIESCNQRIPGAICRVVMADGTFQEKEFIDLAKRLGRQSRETVRQEAVKRIGTILEQGPGQRPRR